MEVQKITPDQAKEKIDAGEKVVFLDDRSPKEWDNASVKLPGAIRAPVNEVSRHLDEIPRDATVVTYCT